MDAALAARDAGAILALADVSAWRGTAHGQPDAAAMSLPDGPIRRSRALSETEVLYTDGKGRSWRLVFKDRDGKPSIVLHDRPCPRGGMQPAPEFQRPERPPAQPAGAPPAWTPLECWPLPM